MCHDAAGNQHRPESGAPGPGRRAFGRLLLAGSGLAALAACAPGTPPAPLPGASSASTTAAPAAGASPSPSSSPAGSADATSVAPTATAPAPASDPAAPRHSLTDPASPWVVVNKHRPLAPATFVPADLVRPAVRLAVTGEAALLNSTTAAAAEKMFAAAATAGVIMTLASGYRSYVTQSATYEGYVISRGQAEADTASARPGYSEHQTGWAFDIGDGGGACSFQPCFADQPAAVWAKANAHLFGFVVRYPWMLHGITGYYYEPWHLRYIGPEAATDMKNRGIGTLEEYFGLEAAPAYL
ncbi:D-alanyl-D-alanine carboxypeptidase [Arthrobacter sp. B3I9]|uniref:M15 family metallopeptidase n=1 Tax=Arthrobacter sp. B3I9 TaxID=3042270 RepID=UPI002794A31D|nr:M15 family metallopeptidase [Arthrobacter sp. B3I9]MDQ0849306.1 D-alanyl-D-alanine carboxypeptidase [Arthrobacter sp. B3I9]